MLSIEMFTQKDIERYYRYVPTNKGSDECWIWLGCRMTKGYGYFAATNMITKKRQQIGAHRFAALIKYRQLPKEVFAMHNCDTPACCNPNHIELGDCQKNTKDAVDRGLLVHAKGEQHGLAKLTEEQVKQIIIMLKTYRICDVAREFNMAPNTIGDIKAGRRWKHLSR